MGKRMKITKHHILTLLFVSNGLSKKDIIKMCLEKFGASLGETASYRLLETMTGEDGFVQQEETLINHLSRRRHNKYLITLKGADELNRLNKALGEIPVRSLRDSVSDIPGGKRSISEFLSGRPPTIVPDSKT